MQIKSKIAVYFTVISLCILFICMSTVYFLFREHLYSEFYRSLQSKALMTVAMVEKTNIKLEPLEFEKQTNQVLLPKSENIIIYNDHLKPIFSYNPLEKTIDETTLKKIKTTRELKFDLGPFQCIGILYKTNNGNQVIVVAKEQFRSDELQRLKNIMVWTGIISLLFVFVSGYILAYVSLKPVNDIINTVDCILPTDLDKRLKTENNHDEIYKLAFSFNRLLDRVEDAFKIQKGFMSNVSHEIRNPLTSIVSSAQVILAKDRSKEEYKNCIETIHEEATELEHITAMLMDLARITSNTQQINFAPVRIDEVLWQAKASILKIHPQYIFNFDTHQYPEDAENLVIEGNETLLRLAIYNLLENACKFSPDHTAKIKPYIGHHGEVIIDIIDRAPMIQTSDMEFIFKPFYRSNLTKKIKGSGIGLSLVASIIQLHGAELKLQNNTSENIGNIFTVVFKKKFQ